ncbi:MAG: HD domain-containing phosphohydrolase [Thermoleophilaceae bacterium]
MGGKARGGEHGGRHDPRKQWRHGRALRRRRALCDAIADELGVYGHERTELLAAAQLHDIGKVAIPHEVLEKPARSTTRSGR